MNKARMAVATALLLAVAAGGAFADIGENFAKGGIGVFGELSFYNNFYRIADSTDERNYWELDLSPGFEYFVADRLTVFLAPWFNCNSYRLNADNVSKEMSFGFRVGTSYALLLDPAAQKGLAFTLGAAFGAWFFPGVTDRVAGVEVTDDSFEADLVLDLIPRLHFFVNDRLAPYVSLTPRLIYILDYKNSSGTKVDLTAQESLYLRLTLSVGVAYHIPRGKASLFLAP